MDDAVDLRALMRVQLESTERFTVVAETGDGGAAVLAAERHRPDCLVLDLPMPRMDGLQALPEVRRVSPATKVAVLTGFEGDDLSAATARLGAATYLEKRTALVDLPELLDALFSAA